MSESLRRDAWLVVHAWVEPDHPEPLRVRIRHSRPGIAGGVTERYADPAQAANQIARWIASLEQWAADE